MKDLFKALIVVLILAGVALIFNGYDQKTETVSMGVRAGVIAELDECLADAVEE